MDNVLPEVLIVIALTLTNAFFAGSEIAFVSLREGQLQRLAERSERGRKVAVMAREPNRFLGTVQIFITLAGFFASATAAVSLSRPFADFVEPVLGQSSDTVALILVTLVLAYITLVFGELSPKRIAMQRSEGWALLAVTPLTFLSKIARPAVWMLDKSTDVIVRITGNDPKRTREEVTEEEIRDMLDSQETFTEDQRSIITGAFEIGERTLREIVVPRGNVLSLPGEASSMTSLHELIDAGHSRAPVHNGTLDDVLGIVHVRDLLKHQETKVVDQTRPATVLPESLGVLDALRRLQTTRQQMAIVVNEHGSVEGIITVEDLLEEIVGEIYDEFDREIAEVKRGEDGSIVLPGSFPIHDLPDLEVELPEHDSGYATIAGYVLDLLGYIPEAGEVAHGLGWDIEVLKVEERAITMVKLIPVAIVEDEQQD